MACIGHTCAERRYRANNVAGTAKNVSKDQTKKECQGLETTAINSAKQELAAKVDPNDIEEDKCPDENCKCYLKDWPATWDVLEKGVTFTTQYLDLVNSCAYDVTLTYDYECQERSGKCYKAPPKGGKAEKKAVPKKKGKAPKRKAGSRQRMVARARMQVRPRRGSAARGARGGRGA